MSTIKVLKNGVWQAVSSGGNSVDLDNYATKDYVSDAIDNIEIPASSKSCVVAQDEAPEDTSLLWIDTDDESSDEVIWQVQANWNQNDETAPDYVQGRTHYEAIYGDGFEVLTSTKIQSTDFTEYNARIVQVPLDVVMPYPNVGEVYTVFFDGVPYVVTVGSTYGPPRCLGNQSYFRGAGVYDTGEPFFIWFGTEGNSTELWIQSSELHDVTIAIYYGEVTQVVKQLDEKFIPDSIARAADIPDVSAYQTEAQVIAIINEALGVVENGTY